ncbi:hypothetical protein [Cellulomonas oligotrophica]|uniref:DUF2993 domain-containing protein n=1 Tax=Cellulomonas oligotrophica TaxID=931536 RepID=A0A7Y9JY69_9CELL|nr:hypothetical protein [Cellulomonas oligotrophica]NYD86616.1 hypothetical protein [Cellulomonas oligotrophica]GIG32496.1 hypothetical protein Col01nite_16550 [Cellulomonas oligotrophica]
MDAAQHVTDPPHRPSGRRPWRGRTWRRRTVVVAACAGVVLLLVAAGEVAARSALADRLDQARDALPAGADVRPGPTPALWQALTATADLRVTLGPDALADALTCTTGRDGLTVTTAAGVVTVAAPVAVGDREVPAELDLLATAEDGALVLRAQTVRVAGFDVPPRALAGRVPEVGRLVDGVHVGGGDGLVVASVQTAADGLELGVRASAPGGTDRLADGSGDRAGCLEG